MDQWKSRSQTKPPFSPTSLCSPFLWWFHWWRCDDDGVFLLSSPSIRAVSSVYLVCLPGSVSIAMHTGHPILNQSGLLEHHVACVHTGWFGKYIVRWFQVAVDTLKRTHLLLQLTVFKACQGLASCPRPRTVTCALSPLGRCISGAVDVGGKMLRSEARRSTLKWKPFFYYKQRWPLTERGHCNPKTTSATSPV